MFACNCSKMHNFASFIRANLSRWQPKTMTNKMQRLLRGVYETSLRHPDVKIWIFNYGDAIHVTQWDDQKQIHYSFYEWLDEELVNTQLDNLEQMCWLIANKTARRESNVQDISDVQDITDDQDINYSTERD